MSHSTISNKIMLLFSTAHIMLERNYPLLWITDTSTAINVSIQKKNLTAQLLTYPVLVCNVLQLQLINTYPRLIFLFTIASCTWLFVCWKYLEEIFSPSDLKQEAKGPVKYPVSVTSQLSQFPTKVSIDYKMYISWCIF